MLQNISNNDEYQEDDVKENQINLLLKEIFKPRNCIIYVLTFLISTIEIKTGILPFGLAVIGACLGSTIPIFAVYIISLVSVAVSHGGIGFSNYFYTSLIFFLLIFFFKPKVSTEDRNEIFKVGTRLFLASFIYCIIKNVQGKFLVSDIFGGFIFSLITYTFYKIFVNGITVIRDYSKKEAFTVEEIIAASIIFAMAVSAFRSILIFNYSISDIFIIFLIIYIGIKYGSSFGGITGLAIGASLTLISNVELFQICVFIISGILSGILGYILMPDRFRRKAFNSEMLLGNSSEHRLNYYEEIKEKISAVAKTISDMNSNFFVKNDEEDIFNKEEYIDNFLNLIENYPENIFYDDVINNEELIGDFFDYLTKEDVITEKVTIEIFKKYHNYILLRDQKLKDDLQELIKIANRVYHELQLNSVKMRVKREEASKLENQLKNVTNIITSISKDEKEDKFENKEKEINTLLRGKAYPVKNVKVDMCENGKYLVTLSFEQFNESIREKNKITNIEILISRSLNVKCSFQKDKKILSTGEYTQVYSADDKFALQVGNSKISKDGTGKPSGDSNLQIRLNDGKYLLAISDGMGNGKKAQDASKFVINTLNTLLSNGFEKNETIQLINSELNFNKDDEMYATIDMSILDLYNGKILISKNGACNTYIKNKRSISVYKGNNLPVGIIQETSLNNQEADLNEGDIILMCSDGLIACKNEMKADWIEEFLKNIDTNNVQKIADLITNEAIDNSFGVPQDDITVIVAKIIKKK